MPDKVFQAVFGSIPAELVDYIESVRVAFSGYEYQILQLDPIDDPIARSVASDNLRFKLALEYPRMWWVDLDCRILRRPDLEDNSKPWHAIRAIPHTFPKPGAFFFYTNGCTEYYRRLIEERDRLGIFSETYCWPQKVLRGTIDDVAPIPDECYEHTHYTRRLLGKKK